MDSDLLKALRLRLTLPLLILALIGWGLVVWFATRPAPAPVERIVNRTEFVDRVVNKVVKQLVKRSDGTTIETSVVSNDQTKAARTASDKTANAAPLPNLSLGLSLVRPPTLDFREPTNYRLELGQRTWKNLWTTTSLDLDSHMKVQQVSIGLRYEF